MSTHYDETVFQKFKALAISDPKQLVIGKTYYSNIHPTEFKIKSFSEMWIVDENSYEFSLRDRNIGAHYNPWLIFETKETRDLCETELTVVIEMDDCDDNYD